MKILAIIPARSGSKSIKDKNIVSYKGKPLLAHSVLVAKKSSKIDRIIVSTNSKKYKKIAEAYGAEVPFLRPNKISTSKSLDAEFIKHCCFFLIKNNYIPDVVVLLRPTTPNRDIKVIDKGINYFLKNLKKYDSMRSVSIFNQPPQKMFQIKKNSLIGFFNNFYRGEYHSKPRQEFPITYLPNGYIDAFKTDYFIKKKNNELFGKMLPFITKETLDIDEKRDFKK